MNEKLLNALASAKNIGVSGKALAEAHENILKERFLKDGTCTWFGSSGYEQLVAVLQDAHNQAAHGKGKERHANDLPFHEQRMQSISKLINSPKGLEFQAIKKLTEGMQFDDAARREKELLGAINYIAGIIIYYRNVGVA